MMYGEATGRRSSLSDTVEVKPQFRCVKCFQDEGEEAHCWYSTGLQADLVLLAQVTAGFQHSQAVRFSNPNTKWSPLM